ncbi:MAG: helix-turn-helix domain-containing protein [Acidobacteria bacterium]|jgi:two-component system response regulator YesN|nr:helix-turn-helix domain-containing protein [Acidobacteriota bacterium]
MGKQKISDRVTEFVLTRKIDELALLKVSIIADTFGVNPSYLSRTFKGDKDITLNELITGEKMFRSALLLKKNKSLTMDDMAKIVGFSRADYFITLFKDYFGVHPRRFKRNWKSRRS